MKWPERVRVKAGLIFMVCLATSILFWFLQTLNKTHQTTLNLSFNLSSIPQGWISETHQMPHLQIQVRGPGFAILGLNLKHLWNPEALDLGSPNLKQTEKGTNILYWTTEEIQEGLSQYLPSSIQLLSLKPKQVEWPVQPLVQKVLPLCPQVWIQDKAWKLSRPLQLSPSSIPVSGPKAFLDSLSCWSFPFSIIPQEATNGTMQVNLESQGQMLPGQKAVFVEWSVSRFTEVRVDLPIVLRNAPEGFEIQPAFAQVWVSVPMDNPDISEIKVFADFSEASTNKRYVPLEVQQPKEGPKLIRLAPHKVELFKRKNP